MTKVLYIGNKLSKKGKTVTSIETLGNYLLDENFDVRFASNKSNKVIRLIDMILLIIKNYDSKYVLIDTYSTQNFYFALITSQICRLLRIKYLPILRGGNLPYRLIANPLFCKWIFKNAYKNIAPSEYLLNIFKDEGYDNLKYISNSIPLKNYQFREKNIDTPKLLWVRSFSNIYNPENAIELIKELKKKYENAELCMVGPEVDGSLNSTKLLANKYKIEVKFAGKLSKKEWINLSNDYNIFINTTNFDNMPVSVIEAMALGLPIISTNVGGIPFLIENKEHGLLVDSNDVEAMSNQIVRLTKDPKLVKHLTSNARKKVEQFDWDVVRNKWNKLLK